MAATPIASQLAAPIHAIFGPDLPIRIRAWDGSEVGPTDAPAVVIRSKRALRRILWQPDELGLARAYVTGELDVDGDLRDGFRRMWQFARDRRTRVEIGWRERVDAVRVAARLGALAPPPRPPKSEARLRGGVHSKARDRAVIAHHYDLSNDFYQLILDDNMAYSSGYWATGAETLSESQDAKLELICRKLQLQPGMTLLDVGCGWGSLSIHAARHHGVRVAAITLSREQLEFAAKRAADLGIGDLIDFRLCDYRDMHDGPFDAATSIEMGEHVGAENYPTFIATLQRSVRPGGRVLIQQMSRGSDAPGGGPFIESYIAPDMYMRPLGETIGLIEAGGLEAIHVESLRRDYVRTVDEWSATFERHWDQAVELVGEEVARVWRLYLVGGALAFEEGRMGVDQILAVRPVR